MRKIIFIFLITFNFSSAQVINNCTTTNFLTKTDASGNLVCSSIVDDGTTINIGSPAWIDTGSLNVGKSLKVSGSTYVINDNLFLMQNSTGTSSNKFLWFIDENKPPESQIWVMGSTKVSGGYGASNGLSFMESFQTRLFLQDGTGNIGIGTTTIPANYKLAVAGKIIAEELKVQLQTSWPDYVFTNDYKLPTLQEVEKQIKEKGHLKNVPSAQEVKENGIELGEITRIQQEKIEELTLYIIELNKKLEALEAKVNDK